MADHNIDQVFLRKKEILEHIVLTTGVSMGESRRVVDAFLMHLHDQLLDSREIALHPLGRIRIIDRETDNGPERIYKLVLQKTAN